MSFKKTEHGLRNAPDAEFDGGAVLHQRGDVFGNLPGRLGDFGRSALPESASSHGTSTSMSYDVDEAIAQRARHVRVDLRDDERGVFGGAFDDVHRHAEAAHAVLVRRRDLDQGHVQRQLAAESNRRGMSDR